MTLDVYHNGIVVAAVIFFAPDVEKQPVGANHLPAVLTEVPENGKLRGC